ncbi:MAG: ATP-binding cassette domain-containing protein, partial [Coprobacillaceae bacterium]
MSTILKTKDVNFTYGQIPILTDINIQFERGKVHAIIGSSGSGKTTLLSILSGITSYQEGSVLFNGEDLSKLSLDKYRK